MGCFRFVEGMGGMAHVRTHGCILYNFCPACPTGCPSCPMGRPMAVPRVLRLSHMSHVSHGTSHVYHGTDMGRPTCPIGCPMAVPRVPRVPWLSHMSHGTAIGRPTRPMGQPRDAHGTAMRLMGHRMLAGEGCIWLHAPRAPSYSCSREGECVLCMCISMQFRARARDVRVLLQ